MVRLARCWLFVMVAIAPVTHAWAQPSGLAAPQTRSEALKAEREEKQTSTTPYTPNGLERGMFVAEKRLMPFLTSDGIYFKFGSLATGSGFAYGAGYRHRRLFDREGALSVWAAASLKRYWAVEGRFDMPDLADGRLEIGTYARRTGLPARSVLRSGPGSTSRRSNQFSTQEHARRWPGRGEAVASRHCWRRARVFAARARSWEEQRHSDNRDAV